MTSRRHRTLALLAAAPLVLSLAACGGDDDVTSTTAAATDAVPVPSASVGTPSPAPSEASPSPSSAPTTAAPTAPPAGAATVPGFTVADEERDDDDGVLDVDLDVDVTEVLTEEQVRALVAELQTTYTEEAVYDLSVDCGGAGDDDDVAEADWAVGAAAQRESGLAEGEVRVELDRDAVCG